MGQMNVNQKGEEPIAKTESAGRTEPVVKAGEIEKPAPIAGFANFGHIPLEGMANARDLGGMPTEDGRVIKMGRLLRSDALHHATEADLGWLMGACNVRRVFDFRSVEERQAHPDPQAQMDGVVFYETPVFNVASVGVVPGQGLKRNADDSAPRSRGTAPAGTGSLSQVSFGARGHYRLSGAVRRAAEGGGRRHSVALHRGQGSTGLAAVLVEHALGVSDEDIRKDYLATNLFAQTVAERIADALGRHHIAERADMDLDAVFYAYEDYLDEALAAVERDYGSLDWYMEEQLGVTPEVRRQLQDMYLE